MQQVKKILEEAQSVLIEFSDGRRIQVQEFNVEESRNRILLSFFNDETPQIWSVQKVNPRKSFIKIQRGLGKETALVKVLKTEEEILVEKFACKLNLKIKRKLARNKFLVEDSNHNRMVIVLAETTAVSALTKAILALKNSGVSKAFLLLEERQAQIAATLKLLLKDFTKSAIEIYEKTSFSVCTRHLQEVFSPKLKPESNSIPSKLKNIIKQAPEQIEVKSSSEETTFYFLGLPFLFANENSITFGIENKKLLTEETYQELIELVEKLKKYRNPNSHNKKHLFYQMMPERWLEAVLKKSIKELDSNLLTKPVYSQLGIGNDRIDLTAFRRDGKIVVIEIKTRPEAEMLFQALEYWFKIESARQQGAFDSVDFKPSSTLIYLVAPALSFHKEIDFLAKTVESVEIHRFDLDQNWRRKIKVLQKRRL